MCGHCTNNKLTAGESAKLLRQYNAWSCDPRLKNPFEHLSHLDDYVYVIEDTLELARNTIIAWALLQDIE